MMKSVNLQVVLLAALQLLGVSLHSQKHFNLTVQLPKGIEPAKVEAWLEDVKVTRQIFPESNTGNQLVFTGDYYSIYAAINLQYNIAPPRRAFASTFFIQEKSALVKIAPADDPEYPFGTYSLENALDFKEEKKEMQAYLSAERQKALDYESAFGDKIFGSDTAIRNPYVRLTDAIKQKELAYVATHQRNYYSFYSFRQDLAKYSVAPPDSLLKRFKTFPNTFKYSDEGNYLNEFLHGKQLVQHMGKAVDFTSRDINKNEVKLSAFKGKKYVLLHFWATWCTPCMKEIPAIKEIREAYAAKDLQIISIALPSSRYTDYLSTIKKLKMDWIHVYDDEALQNKYGNQPTPRLCLIDKAGNVIYDSVGAEGNDFKLNLLKEKLKEVL